MVLTAVALGHCGHGLPAAWEPPWERWSYDTDHHRPSAVDDPRPPRRIRFPLAANLFSAGQAAALGSRDRDRGHHSCDSSCVLSLVRDTLETERR